MKIARRLLVVLAATAAWTGAEALAVDSLQTTDGRTVIGTIDKVSPKGVTISKSGVPTEIPANEVVAVTFDGEPSLMRTARDYINDSRYEEALESLAKVNVSSLLRPELKAEYDYLVAYASTQQALAGQLDRKAAAKLLTDFVDQNHRASYHYVEVNRMAGDLLALAGDFAAAEKRYGLVASAPWPESQMQAGNAIGRVRLAQKDIAGAKQAFQQVADRGETTPTAQTAKQSAKLGLARCLVQEKDADQAIALTQDVIDKAASEDVELLADAYNTLGLAHRLQGQPKDAILAFLHVDLLYFSAQTAHVEALKNLYELWGQIQMPERANDALQTLRSRYNVSVD